MLISTKKNQTNYTLNTKQNDLEPKCGQNELRNQSLTS